MPQETKQPKNIENARDSQTSDVLPALLPLTPTYIAEKHDHYVIRLENALREESNFNVALAGPYGSGKSSILEEFKERRLNQTRLDPHLTSGKTNESAVDVVITLSMSTLATPTQPEVDEEIPPQALTASNLIQQEIVKQLLYREDPRHMPSSRFKRIERFRWRESTIISLLLASCSAVAMTVVEWDQRFLARFGWEVEDRGPAISMFIATTLLLTALILGIMWLLHGRIGIKQLSLPAATVSLDKSSVSYFDQYLDEIVYFFETSDTTIVIFEDIDRFDDPHIFESLLALNKLINNSPQVKQRVKFVYAVKDSIFAPVANSKKKILNNPASFDSADKTNTKPASGSPDARDIADKELIRSNRTKFFDIIIPVVPFATYQNSRDLLTELMEGVVDIEKDPDFERLFAIAGKYVPDMRLLKSTRNEFVVYRDVVFPDGKSNLALKPAQLFAMILYKNFHLEDFENIRHGKSNLNKLYRYFREFVSNGISERTSLIDDLESRDRQHERTEERAAQLGGILLSQLDRSRRLSGSSRSTITHIQIQGSSLEEAGSNPRSSEFWDKIIAAKEETTIFTYSGITQRVGDGRVEDILAFVDSEFDKRSWGRLAPTEIHNLKVAKREISCLRKATFQDLSEAATLTATVSELNPSPVLFDEVIDKTLDSKLSRVLVREGFIDPNFALYISAFYGKSVHPDAMRFDLLHIQPGKPDAEFQLSSIAAKDVLSEFVNLPISDPVFRNYDLLTYLLENHTADFSTQRSTFIADLAHLGESRAGFVSGYLSRPVDPQQPDARETLLKELLVHTNEIFDIVIELPGVDIPGKLHLIDVLVMSVPKNFDYFLSAQVRSFLRENQEGFKFLTDADLDEHQVIRIAKLLKDNEIEVKNLRKLGHRLRQQIIERGIFQILRSNIEELTTKKKIALDIIHQENAPAYNYLARNLGKYLAALHDTDEPISDEDCLVPEINALYEIAPREDIESLLERTRFTVHNFEQMEDIALWPAVVQYGKSAILVADADAYISAIGFDKKLARRLISQGISEDKDEAGEETERVYEAILEDNERFEDEVLISLLKKLKPGKLLTASELPEVALNRIPLLLKEGLVEDTRASLEALRNEDARTRLVFAVASRKLATFMDEELIDSEDASNLLRDEEVPNAVKLKIVEELATYLPSPSTEDVPAIAEVAVENDIGVSLEIVEMIAALGFKEHAALELLMPHLNDISTSKLTKVLQAFGGELEAMAQRNGKRIKIPRSPENDALSERVFQLDMVATRDRNKYGTYLTQHEV